jgi:hypothetical protein
MIRPQISRNLSKAPSVRVRRVPKRGIIHFLYRRWHDWGFCKRTQNARPCRVSSLPLEDRLPSLARIACSGPFRPFGLISSHAYTSIYVSRTKGDYQQHSYRSRTHCNFNLSERRVVSCRSRSTSLCHFTSPSKMCTLYVGLIVLSACVAGLLLMTKHPALHI